MSGNDKYHRLADIVEDAPSQPYGRHNRGKIVVQQYQCSGFTRNIRTPPSHRDTDMCRLQRRRIINAIACHSDDFTRILQRRDQAQFLLRHHAAKNIHMQQPLL